MTTKFDDITLKLQPAGTLHLPWPDFDRAVIFINNKNILDIVMEEEHNLYLQGKMNKDIVGVYHHKLPLDLYNELLESEQTQGKTYACILCCTCDNDRCSFVGISVIKNKDCVIWQDMHNYQELFFPLTFKFDLKTYENFMNTLKQYSLKHNKYTE